METKGYQVVRNKREIEIDALNKTELREELAKAIELLEEMSDLADNLVILVRKFRDGDRFVDHRRP